MASTSGQTGARSPALSVTHVHTGPPADGAAPLRAPWGLEVLQVKPSQTFELPGRRAEAVPAQPPGHEQPGLGSHPRGLRAEQPALPRGWGSSEGRDPPTWRRAREGLAGWALELAPLGPRPLCTIPDPLSPRTSPPHLHRGQRARPVGKWGSLVHSSVTNGSSYNLPVTSCQGPPECG